MKKFVKDYPAQPKDWCKMPVTLNESELLIGGWQVMQSWEEPLMQVMAREVTAQGGDILEIGFGMGISARKIMQYGCNSYTVIEAHPVIVEKAEEWGSMQRIPVTVIEGLWQDVVPTLTNQFDGIFFDTYPLSEQERHRNHFPFIPIAPRLLRKNGVLVYYSDETTEFRAEHLQLLLTYFDEVKLIKVAGLCPNAYCEYWKESNMIVPVARNYL